MKNDEYMQSHPELKDYLNQHPDVRQGLMQNPETFVKSSQQFNTTNKKRTAVTAVAHKRRQPQHPNPPRTRANQSSSARLLGRIGRPSLAF